MNLVAQSVPAASCGSVPLLAPTPGGTPGEPAGEEACATSNRAVVELADFGGAGHGWISR